MSDTDNPAAGPVCPARQTEPEGLKVIRLDPPERLADYRAAMALAGRLAEEHLGEAMLLAWYDRDRDFESPQHSSECHADSAVPGYVDYALSHGARLKVELEGGRFVFFYLPLADEP
ncbi:AF1514 family protein [Thiohalobacter sp. IOR34]|uniref:AF1514 family protein n=1 Tax=Thiohalobacter sp. IOR34 TaxID=3057176 RepID=UPI0025B1CE3F|nr:AF1514 family protein [Thiohalobacter sp. IOR34]WJW75787.1 AF1514 family protein [Thiohalobacter sp. IOR34]